MIWTDIENCFLHFVVKLLKKFLNSKNIQNNAVHDWSQREGISFPFKKFHLVNLGKKKLPGKYKSLIKYGGKTPPWSLKAKYLGVVIDHHLHLKEHMKLVSAKVEKSMFLLRNNSNYVTGNNPETLLRLFRSYIIPHFLYGAPLWIFCIRDKFRYDTPLRWGYGKFWLKLKTLYRKCGRWILGVHPNTSGEAVLVRLGWLPLDYLLALHGLKTFLKLYHGQGGQVLKSCTYDRGNCLEAYGHGDFFSKAYEFLTYLNTGSDVDLMDPNIIKNDSPLRKSLYHDLNRVWKKYEGAKRTKSLHKIWGMTSINLVMGSKIGTSFLHGAACGTGVLRCDLKKIGVSGCQNCRKGCSVPETLEHIILKCPFYEKFRPQLICKCKELGLEFSVINAMCHPKLHLLTEKFFANLAIKVS